MRPASRPRAFAGVAALACALWPAVGGAQSAEPARPARPARAPASRPRTNALRPVPDVVRLRDGAVLRGMIVERSPAGDVTLQLADGQVRRLEAAALEPAVPEPPSPAPPPVVDDGSVPVPLVDDRAERRPRLTVFASTTVQETGGWFFAPASSGPLERLCTAPCTARMPRGVTALYVGAGLGLPLAVGDAPLAFTPGDRLRIQFHDRRTLRTAGFIAGSVLIAGGAFTVLGTMLGGNGTGGSFNDFTVGLGVTAGFTVAGAVLLAALGLQRDTADLVLERGGERP